MRAASTPTRYEPTTSAGSSREPHTSDATGGAGRGSFPPAALPQPHQRGVRRVGLVGGEVDSVWPTRVAECPDDLISGPVVDHGDAGTRPTFVRREREPPIVRRPLMSRDRRRVEQRPDPDELVVKRPRVDDGDLCGRRAEADSELPTVTG